MAIQGLSLPLLKGFYLMFEKHLRRLRLRDSALLLSVVALLVVPTSVQANPLAQPPEPFLQSSLESTRAIESSGHLVLFSPIREIRSEIRSEAMARLPVTGKGQLFEVSRDAGREEARDHYLRALGERGAAILFQCSGVACGRSNVWANQVFQQSNLLGRDTDQDYLVAGAMDSSGQRWLTVVYTVTRGNRREYVWVEHLAVNAGVVIPGFSGLPERLQGPVIVPWEGGITFRFDLPTNDRRRLKEWASDGDAEVILAGFSVPDDDESFEQAQSRAADAIDSLVELLAKSGIRREQIRKLPVGPGVQVPGPDRQGNRIEVLVMQR